MKASQETYEAIARVFTEAAMAGSPPVVAVQDHFDVPQRTASHWVKKARENGYLSAEVQPLNAKLLAVAEAVGVDYHALREAVLTHAGGDLRVS